MMRQVSHKHIVYLYGVCVRDVESKCIRCGRGGCPGWEHWRWGDDLGLMPPLPCLGFFPFAAVLVLNSGCGIKPHLFFSLISRTFTVASPDRTPCWTREGGVSTLREKKALWAGAEV